MLRISPFRHKPTSICTGTQTRYALEGSRNLRIFKSMVFHKHIPLPPLSNYVDFIAYAEGNNKGIGFPKTSMSLIFNLNDSFKLYSDEKFTSYTDYKKHWIAGLQTKPTYVESYGESKMLVVQFKRNGAYAFLNQPLHNFTDSYIPLDCVFNKYADEVWEQLSEASTINEKITVTEKFLLRNLLNTRLRNEKLFTSIDLLLKSKENIAISQICQQHSISRKHLNFLFKEYTGVSPKMMASLSRFQLILQSIIRSKPEKLTDVAYDLDFFDQAHFNNNFKRFTGLTPNDYIRNVEVQPTLKIVPHFVRIK